MSEKVTIRLSEDLLVRLRCLYMDWMDLIGCDHIFSPSPDDDLVVMALSEWSDEMAAHCERMHEIKLAAENGGMTDYLYDIDGNEYYTTIDGVRHYTRQEG